MDSTAPSQPPTPPETLGPEEQVTYSEQTVQWLHALVGQMQKLKTGLEPPVGSMGPG